MLVLSVNREHASNEQRRCKMAQKEYGERSEKAKHSKQGGETRLWVS